MAAANHKYRLDLVSVQWYNLRGHQRTAVLIDARVCTRMFTCFARTRLKACALGLVDCVKLLVASDASSVFTENGTGDTVRLMALPPSSKHFLHTS